MGQKQKIAGGAWLRWYSVFGAGLFFGAGNSFGCGNNTYPLVTHFYYIDRGLVCTRKSDAATSGIFGLSFIGVLMIQGFDYRISGWHLLLGITTSFTMGIAYNCVRKLGSSEHPLVIIFYFPLVCLPITAIWSALFWVQPQGEEWLYLLLLGFTTQFGQYFMTRAYQVAAISQVAIINYAEIIFAIIFGMLLFSESYNLLTYAGMVMVVVGVVMNFLYRRNSTLATS